MMGCDLHRLGDVGYDCGSYLTLQTDSSRCGQKFWDANKIVGGSSEHEEPLHQATAAMAGLVQTADSLDPAERFFDPLALDCTDAIAGMAAVRASMVERRFVLFCETCGA